MINNRKKILVDFLADGLIKFIFKVNSIILLQIFCLSFILAKNFMENIDHKWQIPLQESMNHDRD